MAALEITDIKIRKFYSEGRLRALISVTFNDALAVHDMKVIEGPERYFVAMPSRREPTGTYRDVVHPINEGTRKSIEAAVLAAYEKELADWQARAQEAEDTDESDAGTME
ncbi:MAG: septation regulator SpoVG [Oscillospiraceae bacterium]|nr:septation regulator SpoVG [Oscillospiraceae bacterium]